MAIYHLESKVISKSNGHSATAAAAYRFGLCLVSETTGEKSDYTRKKGVFDSLIFSPLGSPSWVNSIPELVKKTEEAEKRKDSQFFRELVLALPVEFSPDQQKELVAEFSKNFTEKGMVFAVAFHGLDTQNPHAHALLTMRDLTPEGFGKKNRDWNKKELLEEWRKQWAEVVNEHLKKAQVNQVVDHRSHEARGLEELPTIHEGRKARAAARAGVMHPRTAINNARRMFNRALKRLNFLQGYEDELNKYPQAVQKGLQWLQSVLSHQPPALPSTNATAAKIRDLKHIKPSQGGPEGPRRSRPRP